MKRNLILIFVPVLLLAALWLTDAILYFVPTKSHAAGIESINKYDSYDYNSAKGSKETAVTDDLSQSEDPGLIPYALSLIGSPYVYAGISPDGFDCSGFVTHVFAKSGIDLPHSSKLQAQEGIAVSKHKASTGDLVIFTGTNPDVREPGHVGIVISSPGDTISFVHSSSNGGVKISKVQGTRYDVRFLEVRRVL